MAATRWPAGRADERVQFYKGGQLWAIRPAEEGSWEGPGLQGRAVGGDQACKGGQLGVTKPAEEGSWGRPGLQGRAVGRDPGLQGRAVRGKQDGREAVRHQSGWQGSG